MKFLYNKFYPEGALRFAIEHRDFGRVNKLLTKQSSLSEEAINLFNQKGLLGK